MKIKNPKLLATYRTPGRCEYCNKPCDKREPAHVVSKGSGGSDIACNLVALGQTASFQCGCHTQSHNRAAPTQRDLLTVVAVREGVSADDVWDAINFIRRLDKSASRYRIMELLLTLPEAARKIAQRELKDANRL